MSKKTRSGKPPGRPRRVFERAPAQESWHSGLPVAANQTMCSYLHLYRLGLVGPLRYQSLSVPMVPCRHCDRNRLSDGTPCKFCGTYQCCSPSLTRNLDESGPVKAIKGLDKAAIRPAKLRNPRRKRLLWKVKK